MSALRPARAALSALVALAAAVIASPLAAQRPPSPRIENLSQGQAVRAAYKPVVQRANRSVVEVLVDGDARILGTVVAPDLVVTKYSELKQREALATSAGDGAAAASSSPRLSCKQGEASWAATLVGSDRPGDLALLRLAGAKLAPVEWQSAVPAPGAFLATPDGSELPLGVGVLANAPYQHTRQRAFLGIRFADANGSTAELQEVVEHGAAEAAGLRGGDVIIGYGDQEIGSTQDLRTQLGNSQPGDKVTIKVRRGDAELTFEVTLATNSSPAPSSQEGIWGPLSDVRSGFRDVLQHDTVLEPEDCGGPLVDLAGKVVGVNIARAGRVETLALPAADVQRLVEGMLAAHEQPAGK